MSRMWRGYYFYKQLSRAGQPGMAVARTTTMNSAIALIAFASNDTPEPDAFIVVNIEDRENPVEISIKGSMHKSFEAFRTTEDERDKYTGIGNYSIKSGKIYYEAPAGSVTTFFGL